MKKWLQTSVVCAWMGLLIGAVAAPPETFRWKRHSLKFDMNGTGGSEDVYKNADVKVTFTNLSLNAQGFTRPGFWDGADDVSVRFAFPSTGVWTYVASESGVGTLSTGLDALTGVYTVVQTPASWIATNANYKGFIRVHSSKRYLERHDGSPFFYAADTQWGWGSTSMSPANVSTYLDQRVVPHRYTVVQANLVNPLGQDQHHYQWRDQYRGILPGIGPAFVHNGNWMVRKAFWDEMDERMDELFHRGLVVGIWPLWGRAFVDDTELNHFNYPAADPEWAIPPGAEISASEAKAYARYIIGRYGDRPVIFVPSGEYQIATRFSQFESRYLSYAQDYADYNNKLHPIMWHPGWKNGSESYTEDYGTPNEFGVTIVGQQAREADASNKAYARYIRWATNDQQLAFSNPFPWINLELHYEGVTNDEEVAESWYDRDYIRQSAWELKCLGAAGVANGVHGVYTWNDDNLQDYSWAGGSSDGVGSVIVNPITGSGAHATALGYSVNYWDGRSDVPLTSDGTRYFGYWTKFFTNTGWHAMTPKGSDYRAGSQTPLSGTRYVLANDGVEYIAYYPPGVTGTKTLRTSLGFTLPNNPTSMWYNPRAGTYIGEGNTKTSFTVPGGGNDWVLWITSGEPPPPDVPPPDPNRPIWTWKPEVQEGQTTVARLDQLLRGFRIGATTRNFITANNSSYNGWITTNGGFSYAREGWPGASGTFKNLDNHRYARAAFYAGVAFENTGNEQYAEIASQILRRYGEVLPAWRHWPPSSIGNHDGQFENWDYNDPAFGSFLAFAYDSVHTSLYMRTFPAVRASATNALWWTARFALDESVYNVPRVPTDPTWSISAPELRHHNASHGAGPALVALGRSLENHEMVHYGLWAFGRQLRRWVDKDGMLADQSFNYYKLVGNQIFMKERLSVEGLWTNKVWANFDYLDTMKICDGYTTPASFKATYQPIPDIGFHINNRFTYDSKAWTNYSVRALYQTDINQFSNAYHRGFMLPDFRRVIIGDDHRGSNAGNNQFQQNGLTDSLLYGFSGLGVLTKRQGSAQSQAWLDWTHTDVHSHADALNVIIYNKGAESLGGTEWGSASTSSNPDAWVSKTYNQNLVVVNHKQQKWKAYNQAGPHIYNPMRARRSENFSTYISVPDANHHNNAIMWVPGYAGNKEVQVMEADARDAYRHVLPSTSDKYMRLVAVVRIDANNEYVFDAFRVKGATNYNWVAKAGNYPSKAPALTFGGGVTLSTISGEQSLPQSGEPDFLRLNYTDHDTTLPNAWWAQWDWGSVKHRMHFSGNYTRAIKATGKNSSDDQNSDHFYAVVQKDAATADEIAYLVVHDTYDTSVKVQGVKELSFVAGGPASARGVEIDLQSSLRDYIIYTRNPSAEVQVNIAGTALGETIRMKGRFGYIRKNDTTQDLISMKLYDGSFLAYGTNTLESDYGNYGYAGTVTNIWRMGKPEYDATNSFWVNTDLPNNGILDDTTLFFKWPQRDWDFAYRVRQVSPDNPRRVDLYEDPGVIYHRTGAGGTTINLHSLYLIQSYLANSGYAGYRIPGVAMMDDNGGIVTTEIDLPEPIMVMPTNAPFIAYNDFAWDASQITANITRYTTPTATTQNDGDEGRLKDWTTGSNVITRLTVSGGNLTTAHTGFGTVPDPGEPSHTYLPPSRITSLGALNYGATTNAKIRLHNLSTNLRYNVTLFGDRNPPAFPDRVTRVIISGVDSFVNDSSAGKSSTTSPITTITNGVNPNGLVIRYTNIKQTTTNILFNVLGFIDGFAGGGFYLNAMAVEAFEPVPVPVNQPPIALAGPDRTINITNALKRLDGTVIDDGLPNPPGVTTSLWHMVNGPPSGNVVFTNAVDVDPFFGVNLDGVYTLRLRAWDGEFVDGDSMLLTVLPPPVVEPPNAPPTVSVPARLEAIRPHAIVIPAQVSDDGLPLDPGQTSVSWSVVVGDTALVEIDDSSTDAPSVLFNRAGNYRLRVTVSDGEFNASAEVDVVVYGGPIPYNR